jgi:hypothetical protein
MYEFVHVTYDSKLACRDFRPRLPTPVANNDLWCSLYFAFQCRTNEFKVLLIPGVWALFVPADRMK